MKNGNVVIMCRTIRAVNKRELVNFEKHWIWRKGNINKYVKVISFCKIFYGTRIIIPMTYEIYVELMLYVFRVTELKKVNYASVEIWWSGKKHC